MLLNIILNALVLGIIILIATKGQNKPDISILFGLPIGLGILSGILFLFLDLFSIVISLGIAIFALRWAFELTTKQALIVTGAWGVWQILFSMIK
jgi:presenilin-like A22 family membrane protease